MVVRRGTPVFAIVELPPPVTGNSLISKAVCEEIAKRPLDSLTIHDVSAHASTPAWRRLRKTVNYLSALWNLATHGRQEHRRLYLVCEGRAGLPLTLLTVLFSRLCGREIFLHHHSFGYINQPTRLMGLINASLGPSGRHLFLSEGMAKAFFSVYRPQRSFLTAHNLAHIGPFWSTARKLSRPRGERPVRVGLLSNLSFTKGLDTFIRLADLASTQCLDVEFWLAGPINDPRERAYFDAARERLGDRLKHTGSRYGEDKVRFYRELDVFVFPTRYYHEAQPVVIHEALAAGCAVISTDRGCIAEDLRNMGGFVVPRERAEDPSAYLEFLKPLLADPSHLAAVRARSLQLTRRQMAAAAASSQRWLDDLTCSGVFAPSREAARS